VDTVDAFQGQERDIMAITLTRSNPQGEIGFLSDDICRMSVCMTRARRKLLLVGDSSTLCRHVPLGQWRIDAYIIDQTEQDSWRLRAMNISLTR